MELTMSLSVMYNLYIVIKQPYVLENNFEMFVIKIRNFYFKEGKKICTHSSAFLIFHLILANH